MSTFVGTCPIFRSAQCVAMETMHFHIAHLNGFLGHFPHLGGLTKQFTPIRSCPESAGLV